MIITQELLIHLNHFMKITVIKTMSRIEKILRYPISKEKLNAMESDARFFSSLSDFRLKKFYKFRYKRLTKMLFPEYFLKG